MNQQLQETSVAASVENDNFDQIVELDLFGKCTPEQEAVLNDDIQFWRDELVRKLTELDKQFATYRAASLTVGTREAKKTFATWKAKALGRKLSIVSRLQDVNEMLKDERRERKDEEVAKKKTGYDYQRKTYFELRKIRKLLESAYAQKAKVTN